MKSFKTYKVKVQMMRKAPWLALLVLLIASTQQQTAPRNIQLNQVYGIALTPNNTLTFQLTIPDNVGPNQNLYISGYSPINDPFQQPILTITSDDGYSLACESQLSDLNEVCSVPNSKLKKGSKFTIIAKCITNCNSRLIAYLSQNVELDINQQIQITTRDSPIEKQLKIYVRKDQPYTEINLVLDVRNKAEVKQGVEMYIKCGTDGVFPTSQAHDNPRIISWGEAKAAILRKDVNIRTGDYIYVLLAIGSHTTVTFESRIVKDGVRYLQINQLYYDHIEAGSKQVYQIDVSSIKGTQLKKPIIVEFIQYEGSPDIEVSTSDQFKTQQLISQSESGWVRFIVTPEMMKTSDFKDIIYVRVSGKWAATFSLYARFKMTQFDFLIDGLTEFIQVQPNQIGIVPYRHFENLDNTSINKVYEIKLQNEGGVNGDIAVYACTDISICDKYQNLTIADLSLPNYKKLQVEPTRQTFKVQHSPSDCLQSPVQGKSICMHIITITPKDPKKVGKYAITVLDEKLVQKLSEGDSILDYADRDTYKFYSFYLSSDIQQTAQVLFFVNTLDGNILLYASKDVARPTANDSFDSKVKTSTDIISFKSNQIQKGTYYLTVYASTYSDYVINVIVRRKNTSSNGMNRGWVTPDVFSQQVTSTDIELADSLAQSFDLEKGTTVATFRFRAMSAANITLITTQLIGKVKTSVTRESNHKKFVCQQNYCTFQSSGGQSFFVQVQGDSAIKQKFTIVYKQTKQCYRFPLGTPIYVQLDKKDTQCLQVFVKTTYPIEISNSLTNLQLLNKQAQVVIQFESNNTFVMTKNSHSFSVEELAANCPANKEKDCKIKIKFISSQREISLQSIIQGVDLSITLYDGVVQKMNVQLSAKSGRMFRYPVNSDESIQIFLNSQTYSDYAIFAKIVESHESKMYDKYPNINDTSNNVWKVNSSADSPQITLLPISTSKIKKSINENNIKSPWLLISIYGSTNKTSQALFAIEITQSERTLREGEQQVGFIQPNQIVMYEVYATTSSLLSVRSLYNSKCLKLLDWNKKQVGNDVYIEQPRNVPLTYYIKTEYLQSCMYQISLQDYQDNIVTVSQGFPTRVVAEYNQVAYLLYSHNRNSSFRIYQFVQAGMSSVYATPIDPKQLSSGLRNLAASLPLANYKYKERLINNLQVQAKENSTDYCYNCYYLIAIKGEASVQEDVVIVKDDTPVTLRQHSIVDSYLDPGQNQTFIYYAGPDTKFNLSIDVIYGRVTVTVKHFQDDSQGKIIKVQSVEKNMVTIPVVELPSSTRKIPTDSLNQQYKYRIEVQGVRKALYHLQIIKYEDSFRIAQGMVSKITMPAFGTINLEFDNYIDRGQIALNVQSNVFTYNPLSVSVYFQRFGQISRVGISFNKFATGSVINLKFNSMKGRYFVNLRNPLASPFDFVVLMPRADLTQLRAGHFSVADHQTIFQLLIQDDTYAIIQVFGCQGNIKVRGSDNYQSLLRGGSYKQEANLLHQNVGGHFVITTPVNVSGQYFIRVQNKEYEANINSKISGIKYMIRYRLNNKNQKNPYTLLDAASYNIQINYSSSKQNLTLLFNGIQSTDQTVQVKLVTYVFIIGKSAQDIKNYMLCQTQRDTQHLAYLLIANGQEKLELNISKMEILKKLKQHDASYIGGIALVQAKQNDGTSFTNLVFVYEPAYMGKLRKQTVITAMGFFQIMFIIFTALGACIVLYALSIQIIRVWRGYSNTNDLVEEASEEHNTVGVKSSQFQISNQHEQKNHEEESIPKN